MRGVETKQATMLTLTGPERRVPAEHPLRKIKVLVDGALTALSDEFDAMYSTVGRPSIAPERLLKSTLLMALYTIRSERLFCEQLDYNLLFRWFLDMDVVEPSFDHSTFSANRVRLLKHDIAQKFFEQVVEQARALNLMSDEHFTVDGTLIEAWASLKSFRPKNETKRDPPDDPGNPTVDFHGEKRSNETHQSTTDPEARLAKKGKGKEAKLAFSGNALMENRNGLLVDFRIVQASGYAERETAISMVDEDLPGSTRVTVAGDKGYDTKDFVHRLRELKATPHVARNERARGGSAIDARTTRFPGYLISQVLRKLIEEAFGWMKTIGNFRKTRYKGIDRTRQAGYMVGAAYNLLRITRLIAAEV